MQHRTLLGSAGLCVFVSACGADGTISGGLGNILDAMDQPGFWLRLIALGIGLAIMWWLSDRLFPFREREPPPDHALRPRDAVDARVAQIREQRRPEQERARQQETWSRALRQEFRQLLAEAFRQATRYPVHITGDYETQIATKTKDGGAQTWATINLGADDAPDRFYMYGLLHSQGYVGNAARLAVTHPSVTTALKHGREVYLGPKSALPDIVETVVAPVINQMARQRDSGAEFC